MGRSQIDLTKVGIRRLRAELKRREDAAYFKSLPRVELPPQKIYEFTAGEELAEGTLVVWDEETTECFAHPEHGIIPGKRRMCGYTSNDAMAGQRLKLRHWFTDRVIG